MAPTTSPPRRRFFPQPVETTTRSSKRQHLDTSDQTTPSPPADSGVINEQTVPLVKPRRFSPQPVEESTRSSRRKNEDKQAEADSQTTSIDNTSNKPCPKVNDSTNSELSASKPRRFAPEPVETTTRTSRRKFAVEPVETTMRSSRDKTEQEKDTSPTARPRRRFAPEPVETTVTSSRRRRKEQDECSIETPPESPSESSSIVSSRRSTGSRKFSPELIETAKASYRHNKDSDSPRKSHLSLKDSPIYSRSSSKSPEPDDGTESRFCAASLAKLRHEAHRQHSYCVPNLPIIESESSSEEDNPPSLTESPFSTDTEHQKLAKIEETKGESYTDYVFSLARTPDRKKLEEQAMAAYINERTHEPVSHFAGEEEDEDLVHVGTLSAGDGTDPKTFRRSSQDEHDWEMQNMRKHHAQLEKAKRELQEDTAGVSRFSAAALASRHHQNQAHNKPPKTQKQKDEDAEYARMKMAASPPMLGDDLVFPYTTSPKMTRCDVDQAPRPRRADSDSDYSAVTSTSQQLWGATGTGQNKPGGDGGLWGGTCQKIEEPTPSPPPSAGLWMGSCQKPIEVSRPTTPTRSGIQTPAYESMNPFEFNTPGRGARTPGRKQPRPFHGMYLLPTPPRSLESTHDEFTDSIDKKLQIEKQIEEEFTPRVITQIYNYLSLGFPSLARDFDGELSKISRIPIKELRKDDQVARGTIKGYVGTPEAEGTWEEDEDGVVRGCRRWEALRLYVKEWARQSPLFATSQNLPVIQDPTLAHLRSVKVDAWGATVRKGSWAQ